MKQECDWVDWKTFYKCVATAFIFLVCVTIMSICICGNEEMGKTGTYELEGYAVNSVTLKTEDWNIWRVRNCNLVVDKHYIITFDDNGTIGVEDDIIIDVREKDS